MNLKTKLSMYPDKAGFKKKNLLALTWSQFTQVTFQVFQTDLLYPSVTRRTTQCEVVLYSFK